MQISECVKPVCTNLSVEHATTCDFRTYFNCIKLLHYKYQQICITTSYITLNGIVMYPNLRQYIMAPIHYRSIQCTFLTHVVHF